MVSPIRGPFSKTITRSTIAFGQPVKVREKSTLGYRQKRPYNLVLPATCFDIQSAGVPMGPNPFVASTGDVMAQAIDPRGALALGQLSLCHNVAYSRFVGGLGENAGLLLNYAQRQQGIDMLAKRASQLSKFVVHLRRFEFGKAADTLNISKKQLRKINPRKGAKSFSDTFLEFHFGWSPLIHDIGSTAKILTEGVPPVTARGSCRIKNKYVSLPSGYNHWTKISSLDCFQKIGASISVDNPNIWLANQMGLLNPLSVAWDAVPFSFVVDWFVNVNEVLSSCSDLWGLNIQNPYCTSLVRSVVDATNDPGFGPPSVTRVVGSVVDFSRQNSLGGGPSLKVRKPWQLSVTRGVTAISLLIQKMR